MIDKIRSNLLRIQDDIVPYTVNIIAVTKYYGKDVMIAAYKAGLRNFGESRVNDALDKMNSLPKDVLENSQFHFIGHLQSNKVKKVVKHFDFIHSVDSLNLAKLISDEALALGKQQKVFLQINNACEESKFGFSKDELENVYSSIIELNGLKVMGLMNIAPLNVTEQELSDLFSDVRDIQNGLNEKFNYLVDEISMGMSNDYSVAVRYGATWLRIGRKLFS